MQAVDSQGRGTFLELGVSIPAFFLLLLAIQLLFTPGLLRQGAHLYVPYKKIVVGGSMGNPPYQYLDENNQPAGYNIDLTKAVAAEMKVEVEIVLGGPIELEREFLAGNIDLLQGVTRADSGVTSYPFFRHSAYSQKLFANVEYPERVQSLNQLKSGRVYLSRKTPLLEQIIEDYRHLEFIPVSSHAEALKQLSNGAADFVLITHLPGVQLSKQLDFFEQERPNARIVQVGELRSELGYGYSSRKDNVELLEHVRESFTNLELSGRQKEIKEQWLGKMDNSEPSRREKSVQLGGLIFSPLLLVVCMAFYWNHSLKREVGRRSRELAIQHHQLIQADKMTSLGILVAGVAHEINNPAALVLHNLSTLKRISEASSEVLEERYAKEGDFFIGGLPYSMLRQENAQIYGEMEDGMGRIVQIVNDLKDFARKDSIDLSESTSLNRVVKAALRLLESSLRKRFATIQVKLAENLPDFSGNSSRVQQVVINLVMNAVQAGGERELDIIVMTSYDQTGGELVLRVKDNGVGISNEQLVYLCDPFYTTKREQGGTGLGLSISEQIIKEHRGRLQFDSEVGRGTTVSMYLPVMKGQSIADEKDSLS
ncbi:ATP-binding protein [Desulfosediminicola sp.]|uniref:ATP-binding protein n=1 Tax=Desulfosediminicola sp. TaxID=2886825 RepID=UPI003AF2C0A7